MQHAKFAMGCGASTSNVVPLMVESRDHTAHKDQFQAASAWTIGTARRTGVDSGVEHLKVSDERADSPPCTPPHQPAVETVEATEQNHTGDVLDAGSLRAQTVRASERWPATSYHSRCTRSSPRSVSLAKTARGDKISSTTEMQRMRHP